MRITTWNLMRPNARTTDRNQYFLDTIQKSNSDIIILTETNDLIDPGKDYESASSLPLPASFESFNYAEGEKRVSVYSKYPFGESFEVSDPYTSVCREISTPWGALIFYATIIGVTGGKDERFKKELIGQQNDILHLAKTNRLCVAGDYNISFSGYPYPSRNVGEEFAAFLADNNLNLLTKEIADVPDHIAISGNFLEDCQYLSSRMVIDQKISDHHLVTTNLTQMLV